MPTNTKPILIVAAGFYKEIAGNLVSSATHILDTAELPYKTIEVPGCFEIPAAIAMAIKSNHYSGYIALGCVIRGETSHYDYVCSESARGLNQLAIDHRAAIGYGIITAESHEQANVRADKHQKDVGGRAANAVITMIKHKEAL